MTAEKLPPVLHIDSGREWRGGQRQAFELMRGLKNAGVSQCIACPPGSPFEENAQKAGLPVRTIPMAGEWDLFAPGRIARAAREINAGILHAHTSGAHGLGGRALSKLPGAKLIVSRRVDFEVSRNFLSRRKYLNPRVHYIAISNGVKDVLIAGGVLAGRIDVVPSGIRTDRFTGEFSRDDLLKEFNLAPDTFIIANIGSLSDHKGQRYLIEAARSVIGSCPQARFFIVGDGELRQDLQMRVEERGLEGDVVFTGHRDDVEKFLAGMDLFALSSHLEGLCTSLLDSMFFSKPLVGTDTGGVPDAIQHEVNGLLVKPRDPDALAQAIVRMIRDEELRKRCGEAGREILERKFTAEKMVEGTMAVYQRLANE